MGERVTHHQRAERSEVQIAMKKNWGLLLFCAAWLLIWTGGGIAAWAQLLRGSSPGQWLLIGWLIVWFPAEIFVGYASLWSIFGKEVVWVDSSGLTVQRNLLGWAAQTRRFRRSEVGGVRAAPFYGSIFSLEASLAYWGLWGGSVAFDSCGRTVRFGIQLSEREARQLADWLSARLA